MSSTDTFLVNRYSFHKDFIASGTLTLIEEGSKTELIYKDNEVEVHASDPAIPVVALDSLRTLLETKHKSIISINGCRIDVSHGGEGVMCYISEQGKKATENVYMFEPTLEAEKLCTLAEHEAAYDKWIESVMPMNDAANMNCEKIQINF